MDKENKNPWKFERRPGGWIIATRSCAEGGIERRRLQVVSEAQSVQFQWNGQFAFISQRNLARIRSPQGGGAAGASQVDVKAAMTAQFPGKVRKVLVKAGQTVAKGEKLVLVEAMKMEFAIQAPIAGLVKGVLVKETEQVTPGALFVDFEPEAAAPAKDKK